MKTYLIIRFRCGLCGKILWPWQNIKKWAINKGRYHVKCRQEINELWGPDLNGKMMIEE